jgi:hypothetical protein
MSIFVDRQNYPFSLKQHELPLGEGKGGVAVITIDWCFNPSLRTLQSILFNNN